MSRYIDATELSGYKFGLISPYIQKLFHQIVNEAPTADVRANIHARWIKIYPEHEEWNVYECSYCGEEFNLIEGTPYDNGYNFCPNCGADMRNT